MNATSQRLIAINVAWIVGILATFVGLLGYTADRVAQARTDIHALQGALAGFEQTLASYPEESELIGRFVELDVLLSETERLAGSQAVRISELSSAARDAGVTIDSLESLSPRTRDDDRVLQSAHRLVLLGRFQDIGECLEAIATAPGVCSLDELSMEPVDDAPDDLVRASFEVSWFSPGPALDRDAASEEP
jgi:hypothetical protein